MTERLHLFLALVLLLFSAWLCSLTITTSPVHPATDETPVRYIDGT